MPIPRCSGSGAKRPCTDPPTGGPVYNPHFPPPAPPTGQALVDCAPEIAQIVMDVMGPSYRTQQMCAYDRQGDGTPIGTCLTWQTTSLAKRVRLARTGTLTARELATLRLGNHEALGSLDVRMPSMVLSRRGRHDGERALQALLPRWSAVTGHLLGFPNAQPGGPRGDLPSGPMIPVIAEMRPTLDSANYKGLFWKDNLFQGAVEYALATLLTHAELAVSHPLAPLSHSTPARIRGSLQMGSGMSVVVTDRDLVHCSTYYTSYQYLDIDPGGWFGIPYSEAWDVNKGSYAYQDGPTIGLCGTNLSSAALADYQFWWAKRLYEAGKACGSEWHLIMAVLAARSALAEITFLAGELAHELTHAHFASHRLCRTMPTDINRHCSEACTPRVNQWHLQSTLAATYGLPLSYQMADRSVGKTRPKTPGYPQASWINRFQRERWSVTSSGGGRGKCGWSAKDNFIPTLDNTLAPTFDPSLVPTIDKQYANVARHCSLLRQGSDLDVTDFVHTRCMQSGRICASGSPAGDPPGAWPVGDPIHEVQTADGDRLTNLSLEYFTQRYPGPSGVGCFG